MGCTDSRSDLTEQELAITQREASLGFGSNEVVKTDFILRKLSHQRAINPTQLADACKTLNLTTPDTSIPVRALYDLMKVDADNYSLKSFLLLGVLLSYGATADKARILFEIYDNSCTHCIDSFTVRQMVEDLYQLTVLQLPILVIADAPIFEPSQVLGYIEQIKFRGERGKEKLANSILEGNIQIQQAAFIDFFTRDSSVQLLFTWGIRDFLFKVYQQVPSVRHMKASHNARSSTVRSSLKKTRSKTPLRVSFAEEMVTSTYILSGSESETKSL